MAGDAGKILQSSEEPGSGCSQESQYPVEKLAYAVKTMKTPESAKRAAETIQRGRLTRFIKVQLLHY